MTDITYEEDATETIVEKARAFAAKRHAYQRYGDDPYEVHLQAVVDVMTDFGWTHPSWLAAAWLHDVIEDTDTTLEEVAAEFGELTAKIVWAVTGVGETRKERVESIYEKMLTAPEASVLKVADRIANVERSRFGSKHRQMYLDEAEGFYDNVARFVPSSMVSRLADAYFAP